MPDFNVIQGKDSFAIVPFKTDFEVRREKAKEMMFHWTRLQNISVDDERMKANRAQHKNTLFALLSDPLQVGIDPLLADGAKPDDFIKLVRAMYGDDAVDFALQVRESWAI